MNKIKILVAFFRRMLHCSIYTFLCNKKQLGMFGKHQEVTVYTTTTYSFCWFEIKIPTHLRIECNCGKLFYENINY